jgi:dihydroflavonol-4-reductase
MEPNKALEKIFVTGGTGFLGAYIIKNLVERNIPVRALRRSSKTPFFIPKEIFEKVEWVEGDILDVVALDEAMKGVDAVIHSAAIVSFSKHNRRQMYKVNVEGTENVVNLALENKLQRIIHISSVAALGRTAKTATVDEGKSWEENASNTHYAISKHHAEMHLWRGFAEGIRGLIINPSTILGYGNWNESSCAIFKNAYRQFPWFTRGVNGFVGVEDVAELAIRLLLSDLNQQRFVVSAENIEFRELFGLIAEGFGKKKPHREATPVLGEIAWRMEAIKSMLTGRKALLTRETAKIAHSKTSFSNAAVLQALPGFQFQPLKMVIKNSCEKYQKAVDEGLISI